MELHKEINSLFDKLTRLFAQEAFSVSEEPEGFKGISSVKVHERPWKMKDGSFFTTDCICKENGRLFCVKEKELKRIRQTAQKGDGAEEEENGITSIRHICVDELHSTPALMQVFAQLTGAYQAFDEGRRHAPWYDPEMENEPYKADIQRCYELLAQMVAESVDGLKAPDAVVRHIGSSFMDRPSDQKVEPLTWPFIAIPLIRKELKKCCGDIATAVIHTSYRNRWALEQSTVAGCYSCGKIFHPSEIVDWTDEGQTALCPYCGIDSLVLSGEGFDINEKFLKTVSRQAFWDI